MTKKTHHVKDVRVSVGGIEVENPVEVPTQELATFPCDGCGERIWVDTDGPTACGKCGYAADYSRRIPADAAREVVPRDDGAIVQMLREGRKQ